MTKQTGPTLAQRIEAHGRDLLAIFPEAVEQDPQRLCRKLRRLELNAHALAERQCNGPEWSTVEAMEAEYAAVLARVNELLGNVHRAYQPKTGAKCGCRRGIQRDNCSACEGTGQVIDFAAIRARRLTSPKQLVPVFINRDPRGYALKISDEAMREQGYKLAKDWGGYGLVAPDLRD